MASTSEQVVACLTARENFIVEAGAGSGKTRTLVEALTYLLAADADGLLSANQQIVCITYTNVAANEIMTRINRDPLVLVSTIHEFLWSVMAPFQNELRQVILKANDAAGAKRIDALELKDTRIEYWQYPRKWETGKLSHDDVIALSADLFAAYPKLARLVADRFPILFVDEYQDTHERTIKLLLDDLAAANPGRITVGLFGDYMQRIYNTGVGKVDRTDLKVIQKTENYRCSIAVIKVLNELRPALQQVAGDSNVPGSARFFHAADPTAPDLVSRLRAELRTEGWIESREKVLMLTRKGIATDLEWRELLAAYDDRSRFSLDDLMRRDDEFGELFADIESMTSAFNDGRFGDFLAIRSKNSGRVNKQSDKQKASDQIGELNARRASGTVGDVVDFVWSSGLLSKPRRLIRLEERIASNHDLDRAAKDQKFLEDIYAVPFAQVASFERYLNDQTPFSTNHGVKGEEYEDVLVVLDDSLWNQYKFEAVLAGDNTKTQFERSLNLLYVSCSRAKRNLVVFAVSRMSDAALAGAKRIFGESNLAEFN